MGVLLVISSMVALNAALGAIAVDTLATQSQLTWIVDGYTLVMACLLLPAGALGDRYGRRTVLLVGLVIFAAASLTPIYFDSPTALIVARGVTGVGAAAILPATLSLLTAAYPKEERNKAIGIWAGVCASSALVGFTGTALLTQFGPWRTIFWAFVGAAALLFVLALTISSSKDPEATPVDWWGALLIGSAIAVFVFGVIEAPLRGWSDPTVYGCLAGGILLAVVFGFFELRRKHPLLDIRVFRRPDMLTGAIGMTTLFFAIFGFFFLIMQYLQLVIGYSPLQTAVALCPLAVPLFICAALTQWYLPRLGLRISVAGGLAILAAGLLCMCLLEADSTYFDLAWPMLVLSTGMGICNAPSTTAITGAVPLSKQGVASAINDTTRELGGALGIALAGSILAAGYSHALAQSVAMLPQPIREPALGSLAQALTISDRLGPAGGDLSSHAKDAFMHAMHSSLLMLAVVVLVSAAAVAILAPRRDRQRSESSGNS
ncbi:MFS transporter [Mycobacterium bourgelatii]|nr:MFS transporter [Mycobacterium bourgelatii]MCV6976196.1 MFS transporter [Mycobacterium bourgelatii]